MNLCTPLEAVLSCFAVSRGLLAPSEKSGIGLNLSMEGIDLGQPLYSLY